MNDKLYRDAMNRLPFSEDLEAKTLAILKASSAKTAKEEEPMKQTDPKNAINTSNASNTSAPTHPASSGNKRKYLAIGGSVLAAAACLLLVVLPMLQGEPLSPTAQDMEVNMIVSTESMKDESIKAQSEQAADGSIALPMAASDAALMDFEPEEAEAEDYSVSASNPLPPGSSYSGSTSASSASFGSQYTADMGAGVATFNTTPTDWNTEEYSFFTENRFLSTKTSPLSTFAADVDTASYAKLRSAILSGQTVPNDSVRIEEMLNYFHYDYAEPKDGEPFGVTTEIADCPWNPDTQLLLIGLQATEIEADRIPAQNLVFLIDVSGSMSDPNKLPLVKRSFLLLLEHLQPTDTVSIVTYASGDRIVLDGVRASDKTAIMEAIDQMDAGGGTAGSAGIQTAYQLAEKHFIEGGNNRIILATDGDWNIGVSDEGSLIRLVEEKSKSGVYVSVLGYGMGNYKDNKLEALADHGNGNYAYIDTIYEARKALVEEVGGTFFTVAKDVKLQVEFNPAKIKGYRLIGYENRTMAAEDFADDTKDGGEVGSGHRVTVLYEIVPIDSEMEIDTVETKYQATATTDSDEWLTLNIRCKEPDGDTSKLFSYPVENESNETVSDNMRFASAVAECGMLLRDSDFKCEASYSSVLERLRGTASVNGDAYKEEFQYMVTLLMRENP